MEQKNEILTIFFLSKNQYAIQNQTTPYQRIVRAFKAHDKTNREKITVEVFLLP